MPSYKFHQGNDGTIRVTDDFETILTAPAPAAGSITLEHEQFGCWNQVKINLNAVQVSVTDANAYGSLKILDFNEGAYHLIGTCASIRWAVSSARASTINDSASLTWGVGSAAASNATLSGTMVNHVAKQTKVLSAATTAYNTASAVAASGAGAGFDGTATAIDIYLNVGFETGTDIDGDGTLLADGYVILTYAFLGDK